MKYKNYEIVVNPSMLSTCWYLEIKLTRSLSMQGCYSSKKGAISAGKRAIDNLKV